MPQNVETATCAARPAVRPGRSCRPGNNVPAALAASSTPRPVSNACTVDGAPDTTEAIALATAMSFTGRRGTALSWPGYAAVRGQGHRHQPPGAARLRHRRDDRGGVGAPGVRGEVAARVPRAVRRRQRLDP